MCYKMLAFAFFSFAAVQAQKEKTPFSICIIAISSEYKLAALLAAEHINSHDEALPRQAASLELNVSAIVYDQGSKQDVFARGTACINAGANVIIGPSWSSRAAVLSPYVLAQRYIPAVSFTATSPDLSDSKAFPFFTRTIPEDAAASIGAVSFIRKAGWKRVAFLYSDDAYGLGLHAGSRNAAADMIDSGKLEWISVPYRSSTAGDSGQASKQQLQITLRQAVTAGARIIFFAGVSGHVANIMEAAEAVGLIGDSYAWLGFDGFIARDERTGRRMSGSLKFQSSGCPGGPAGNPLVSSILKKVDVESLANRYTDKSALAHSKDLFSKRAINCAVGFAYDAVVLAALAFGSLNHTNRTSESSTCDTSQIRMHQGRSYYSALVNTTFDGTSGRVSLLSNGDREASTVAVSIENMQLSSSASFEMAWVGEIRGSGTNFSLPTEMLWASGSTDLPSDGVDSDSSKKSQASLLIALFSVCGVLVIILLCGAVKYRALKQKMHEVQEKQQQKLSATDMDSMVRSGKIISLLKNAVDESSHEKAPACAALSSFVANAHLIMQNTTATIPEPSTSLSAEANAVLATAATASAIKAFDLWKDRMRALQKDGEIYEQSRFTNEQSRPNAVSIINQDLDGTLRPAINKLEKNGFNVLQCKTKEDMRQRRNDNEMAGFLVFIFSAPGDRFHLVDAVSAINQGRNTILVNSNKLHDEGIMPDVEMRQELCRIAFENGIPVYTSAFSACNAISRQGQVSDRPSPAVSQFYNARRKYGKFAVVGTYVDKWEQSQIDGALVKSAVEERANQMQETSVETPCVCGMTAGPLKNPIFTLFVEQPDKFKTSVFYEDDEMLIFPNIKSHQRSKDGAAAAMSYVHFLIIPKQRLYNAVTLTPAHVPMLKRMLRKGHGVLKSEALKVFYIESRDMDFDASVLEQSAEHLDFFVHLHPKHSVGHLHIHCCLTNLWTQNGTALKEKNTRVHDVIKALDEQSIWDSRSPGRRRRSSVAVGSTAGTATGRRGSIISSGLHEAKTRLGSMMKPKAKPKLRQNEVVPLSEQTIEQ